MKREQHGQHGTRTYQAWKNMRQRCSNRNRKDWVHYGGRGIVVCERWALFSAFMEDMGHAPPGLELDRIDNNRGYEPGNCRWADRSTQVNNTRTTPLYEYRGLRKTLRDWSSETGIRIGTLHHRIDNGWTIDRAFTAPVTQERVDRARRGWITRTAGTR